jgi:two-component system, chemotaxis family, protein-glutamate methylesterase/glutaminase
MMPDSTQHAPPVVVVGASAGGVEALRDFAAALPVDFEACVLVVLHVPSGARSALPAILNRACKLPVRHANDGDPVVAGVVMVAPPDHHLVLLDGRVSLTRGPRENGHRPAVDVLFRTAARAGAQRVAAVVLSGSLDDGAAGALAVVQRGGMCVVQDFDEALYDAMPRAAAQAAGVADGVPTRYIPEVLAEWIATPASTPHDDLSVLLETEAEMAELDPGTMHDPERPGVPAGFGCPDCAGALYEIDDGGLRRFRCRVGHAWSPETLLARQTVALESALWMALRSLEEKAALNVQMHDQAANEGRDITATRFLESAEEARRAAEMVRRLVIDIGSGQTVADQN